VALWRALFNYNGMINQGFANVYVMAASLAIVLWSAAIVRSRAMSAALGVYGLISAALVILGVGAGHVRLNVHGFGMVVVLQAIFFIIAGANLLRTPTTATSAATSA
jgi:hypothetical protein